MWKFRFHSFSSTDINTNGTFVISKTMYTLKNISLLFNFFGVKTSVYGDAIE